MIVVRRPTRWAPEIDWLLGLWFDRRIDEPWRAEGCDDGELTLRFEGRPGRIVLPMHYLDIDGKCAAPSAVPRLRKPAGGGPPLPDLWSKADGPIEIETGEDTRFNLDLIGFAFWMLTRTEEDDLSIADAHGRFLPPPR